MPTLIEEGITMRAKVFPIVAILGCLFLIMVVSGTALAADGDFKWLFNVQLG